MFMPGAFEPGGVMSRIKDLFHKYGFTPMLDETGDTGLDADKAQEDPAFKIARDDFQMVDKADFIVANLTPWPPHPKGKHDQVASADVGTVAETAFALGRGKPIFTFTNNPVPYHERIRRMHGDHPLTPDPKDPDIKRSPDGVWVDTLGSFDNLMLPAIAPLSGGTHHTIPDATHPYEDLRGLELALKDAAHFFKHGGKPHPYTPTSGGQTPTAS